MSENIDPSDLLRNQDTDAHKWARAFCRQFSMVDFDSARSWFANAIMVTYDRLHNEKIHPLQQRLDEAEKVIGFYADGWNWEPFEDKAESQVWDTDRSYWDDRPPFRSCKYSPGKRARSYLQKYQNDQQVKKD